ncbi:hypothetical protein KQH65_11315 [archaeon]|nr:hypothetical protein [archaeon]
MSDEKLSLADILHKNRSFVLAMLGVPVFGMAIAAGLIEKLAKKKPKEKEETSERVPVDPMVVDSSEVLTPEEKRVLPVEDE